MNPILWVFIGLVYFAINSYLLASVLSPEDGRFTRLIIFLFGMPISLIMVVALGITSIIIVKESEEE